MRTKRSCGRVAKIVFTLLTLVWFLILLHSHRKLLEFYDDLERKILEEEEEAITNYFEEYNHNVTYTKVLAESKLRELDSGSDVKSYNNQTMETEKTFVNRSEIIEDVAEDYSKYPGDMGNAVIIDPEKLDPKEKEKFDAGWALHKINQYVSDMVSVHRRLPDPRGEECKAMNYENLPQASIIVTICNDIWSVLIRTINSIVERTPTQLIKEILLVDDASEFDYLKQPLDEYVKQFPKIRIVRNRQRLGVMRARIQGFKEAKGPILVFLDSQVECLTGWLEPLLSAISENKTTVIAPVIDEIDSDTFKVTIYNPDAFSIVGFDWTLLYSWHGVPERELMRRNNKYYLPVRTPIMSVGGYAINREYFEYLGTYDDGMDVWGPDMLEISFKAWMCGGSVMLHPCSHLGHVHRHYIIYNSSDISFIARNRIRLAEVWMDDYKHFYFEKINYQLGDYGDVSARKELRKRLGCKSFQWYVENIYPELFIPGTAIAHGEVRNQAKPICLEARNKVTYNEPVTYPCHGKGGNQNWFLSVKGEMLNDNNVCLDYVPWEDKLGLYPCHGSKGNQLWEYREDNTVFHPVSKKCLELSENGSQFKMTNCTESDYQKFVWKRGSPPWPKIGQKR